MKPCKFKIINYQKNFSLIINKIKDNLCQNSFIYDENKPELIISLGGDGTFLSSLKENHFKGKHLSINLGHLGFFSDYEIDEIDNALSDIINKEPIIEKCPLFVSNFENKNKYFFADVVISSFKTIYIKLSIDNEEITTSKASGIVLSTALGSTGYSLSLNSPVVFFNKPFMMYSLIAPVNNRIFNRTIQKGIIDNNKKLNIQLNGDFNLSIDGKRFLHDKNLNMDIFNSNKEVELIHFKEVNSLTRIKKNL